MAYKLIYKPDKKYRKKIIEFISSNSKPNHPLTNKILFNWFYLIREKEQNVNFDN